MEHVPYPDSPPPDKPSGNKLLIAVLLAVAAAIGAFVNEMADDDEPVRRVPSTYLDAGVRGDAE